MKRREFIRNAAGLLVPAGMASAAPLSIMGGPGRLHVAESGEEPDPGGDSGGTAAFAWSAPDGLANGNSITITSNTETFEQPTKQIWLGYGMGWLYSQNLGASLPSSLEVDGESFTQEGLNGGIFSGRQVYEEGGRRFLRTGPLWPNGLSTPYGAGCLNWDTGGEITASDVVYAFKVSRLTVGGGDEANFQWKQIRIRPRANIDSGRNEAYIPKGGSSSSWERVDVTPGSGSDKGYGTPLPDFSGELSSFGWAWKPNTPNGSDGLMYTHLSDGQSGRRSFLRNAPTHSDTTTPTSVITTDSTDRTRHVMSQDYVGNRSGQSDVVIDITDLYWKVNGDLFLLADAADLDDVTEPPIPLIPTAFNSSGSWTFNLWLGGMSSYEGKFIHRLSALLEPLQVVAL